jgi:hypothetical protein
MRERNTFKPLDLVEDPTTHELFVVQQKKPDKSTLYWAISLRRPKVGPLDVSDKDFRRICSFPELPKAVQSLLAWRKICDRGGGKDIGTFLSTAIRIEDELSAILDSEDDED